VWMVYKKSDLTWY